MLGGLLISMALNPIPTRGSTIRDDVPDSDYTDLGNSVAYAAVGTFVGNGGITGCGILIAPDWVLTAAHLVNIASSGTFTVDGTSYSSDELFTDPAWTGNVFAGGDFGLVHLSTPVSSVSPVMLYTGSSEFGQVGTWVGYGFTGTGLTGYQTSLGNQKRAFQNVIDGDFNNPAQLLGSDFDNPNTTANNLWGDATPLPLEGCVAPGDSGGGVFLTIDSQTYLAGVISFVASTGGSQNSVYGNLSGAGRVEAALPWITSIVPEPSTSALLAGAGLAIFFARRRSPINK
ncbi:MAG TPA: trypsin-like serine protease [Verrucomicrobiae bacterium]|nr:trypsin-like serine protease [Verrucomicrobiae bacterium]